MRRVHPPGRIAVALVALLSVLLVPSASQASKHDSDNDGLSNRVELRKHCNPRSKDTDGDRMPDRYEVVRRLNCHNARDAGADPDRDGLTNVREWKLGTNL